MKQTGKHLKIEIVEHPDRVICFLRGEAAFEECAHLQKALEQLVSQAHQHIVLDLSELTFICSMALGAIITAHLRARRHQGQIHLHAPTKNVLDVLELTKLTKVFPIDKEPH
jgi:anti-sigma B factor antagonist